MSSEVRAHRDQRTQRFLRRLDLEEVLEDLGLEVSHRNGADLYCMCPDESHEDAHPSFHVCVEDVFDERGRNRLGWFNCWSHPGGSIYGMDFLDLVSRVQRGEFNQFSTDDEREQAEKWLRAEYFKLRVKHPRVESREDLYASLEAHRLSKQPLAKPDLIWPPSQPIEFAAPEFPRYLAGRGVTRERAVELGVRAVRSTGTELKSTLRNTVPGVLFQIRKGGADANWFVRGITKRLPSRDKGRYCPGVPLASVGVTWGDGEVDPTRPVVLVEGIFDALRAQRTLVELGDDAVTSVGNVRAVLGGRVHEAQARALRGAKQVVCLADGDAGGATLGESVRGRFGVFFADVRVHSMPEGTDPADAPEEVVRAALARPQVFLHVRRVRRLAP